MRQRIAHSKPDSSYRDVKITSRNGIMWEFHRNDSLLQKLADSLESKGHGALILSLCNWNVADGLVALTEILSNRYFGDFDRIIGDIVPDDGHPETGFSKLTILRALAYGNPVNDPIYPVRRTRIPNLITGVHSKFPKSFLKPRLLQLMISRTENTDISWKMGELAEFSKTFFGKPEKDTFELIAELYDQGLADCDRGHRPFISDSDCDICATPRAVSLWKELADSDYLAAIYRDDLDLSDRHQWKRVPTLQLELQQRCLELLALCHSCVEGELNELRQIASRADVSAFMSYYGDTLFSERVLAGIGLAIHRFYRRYITNYIGYGIDQKYERIAALMASGKVNLVNAS